MRATTAHGAGREFKSFDWSKRMRKRCGNGVWLAMWVFSIGSWGVALADGPGVEVTARLEADALTPGSAGAVMVSYALADGFVIAPDGMVAPIVQVAVPDSVKLDGAVLTDHKKLARNDFLHAPYELAMKQPTQRIAFKVQSPPAADAHIGLNFIVYLRTPTGDARFVRRRLEVPLKLPARDVTGQSRVGADAAPSPWGTGQFLDIGDRADDFTLPRADGSRVRLSDFRGKKNVIVTTYRAFW
jgi:hypothetical protein